MKQENIVVRGAREHNLKNVSVEIPRDQLIVVTGLSGSGKSSLAFDTVFAEGQRRFLESLDAYSKKFAAQLKKPDVDFVYGLSPVISIQQKTVNKNPRSTIGTMTDVYDYFRLLYATVGTGHCPYCNKEVPTKSPLQMLEHLFSLPIGTIVELCAPVFKIYGEDYPYLLGEIRSRGCRRIRVDDVLHDLSDEIELEEEREYRIEAIMDRVEIQRDMRAIERHVLQSIQNACRIGEGFIRFRLSDTTAGSQADFDRDFACSQHGILLGDLHPIFFSFNDADSSCLTCTGLGVYRRVDPTLLVPDPSRSLRGGAFVAEAYSWDKEKWSSRLLYSAAKHFGFDLDTPFERLSPEAQQVIFYGSGSERFPLLLPPGAKTGERYLGQTFRYEGIITEIERRYRKYRKEKVAHTWMEEYLKRVMVEYICPDCHGTRLKRTRQMITLKGTTIWELGMMPLEDVQEFFRDVPLDGMRQARAGAQILDEIRGRVDLLMEIGLGYLSFNRKAATLSGGESQRIRLSTQISSGLMGMLYVLDEPSIGLHPRDNGRLIATLKRLRDLGNTVIVVEHDEETIRSADYVIEMGPGPGVHGGEVVVSGPLESVLSCPDSLSGRYLNGQTRIPIPERRRPLPGKDVIVRGARQNNLRAIDVAFPTGVLVCVTGVSGSGKSTLVNDILFKRLYAHFYDSRTRSGEHDRIDGLENITDIINIDQTQLGRSPRSNPATYIGIYDEIRRLFASLPASRDRGYTASRFSFNVRGGRCEECTGEGFVTTALHFMPEVESPCPTCKGMRYNDETLEVTYGGKSIGDVLALPVEEAAAFFEKSPLLSHKLDVLCKLGLGYIQIGQSCTTLSGGEAQRVKLANELSKVKRGGRKLYVLDEPTTGLHLADIERLLDSLQRLVDAGNTVVVIEHQLDVIKTADWLIDLGPEGGRGGGTIVAQGPPEAVMAVAESHTGKCLRHVLTPV